MGDLDSKDIDGESKYIVAVDEIQLTAGSADTAPTSTGTAGAVGDVISQQSDETVLVGVCYLEATNGEMCIGHFFDNAQRTVLRTLLTQIAPVELVVGRGRPSRNLELSFQSCLPSDVSRTEIPSYEQLPCDATLELLSTNNYFTSTTKDTVAKDRRWEGVRVEDDSVADTWPQVLRWYRDAYNGKLVDALQVPQESLQKVGTSVVRAVGLVLQHLMR
uniref:DNA mismatch repair protein Msh6 n=2 Tax=Lygus hesperus TaxID=30085 RepID=A0A146M1Y2_LYGHE